MRVARGDLRRGGDPRHQPGKGRIRDQERSLPQHAGVVDGLPAVVAPRLDRAVAERREGRLVRAGDGDRADARVGAGGVDARGRRGAHVAAAPAVGGLAEVCLAAVARLRAAVRPPGRAGEAGERALPRDARDRRRHVPRRAVGPARAAIELVVRHADARAVELRRVAGRGVVPRLRGITRGLRGVAARGIAARGARLGRRSVGASLRGDPRGTIRAGLDGDGGPDVPSSACVAGRRRAARATRHRDERERDDGARSFELRLHPRNLVGRWRWRQAPSPLHGRGGRVVILVRGGASQLAFGVEAPANPRRRSPGARTRGSLRRQSRRSPRGRRRPLVRG